MEIGIDLPAPSAASERRRGKKNPRMYDVIDSRAANAERRAQIFDGRGNAGKI